MGDSKLRDAPYMPAVDVNFDGSSRAVCTDALHQECVDAPL